MTHRNKPELKPTLCNNTVQQHLATTPGNKTWQQHLATTPGNNTLQQHLATTPCNNTLQQYLQQGSASAHSMSLGEKGGKGKKTKAHRAVSQSATNKTRKQKLTAPCPNPPVAYRHIRA